MSALRENRVDFEGAIDAASGLLGLSPAFVEKDYWVTQALRSLHHHYPGAFVLKGGTSLSKGYQLIERFSEDVDILMLPSKGDSAAQRERQLREITERVARDLAVQWEAAQTPGRGKRAHRADLLRYERIIDHGAFPADDRGLLFETGYAGGEWPTEMVTLTPILCAPLGLDPSVHEDTAPFDVKALQPVRTLLEKVALLHHVATTYTGDSARSDHRCGRHYYGIYRLLEDGPTRIALADRGLLDRILTDTRDISIAHYGGWSERPDDGYVASPAFAPPADSLLRRWLEARYRDAADLLPAKASGRWPSFGNVLKRVHEHAQLL